MSNDSREWNSSGHGSVDEELNPLLTLQPETNRNNNHEFLPDSNHENDDSDNDDDDDDEESNAEVQASEPQPQPHLPFLPPASVHSYLPGTSHPLHTTATAAAAAATISFLHHHHDDGYSGSFFMNNNNKSNDNEPFDLIIVELPGVVLFPGMTLPLRLEEPGSFTMASAFWQLYRQIQISRRSPGQSDTVQIGVLTKLDPADASYDSDDEEDEEDNPTARRDHESVFGNRRAPPVNTNHQAIQRWRRRSSWMRRGFGPERLRRFSQQLVQELGNVEQFLDAMESVDQDDEDEDEDEDGSRSNTTTAIIRPLPAQRQRRTWSLGPRLGLGGGPRRHDLDSNHDQQDHQNDNDNDEEMPQEEDINFRLNQRRGGNRRRLQSGNSNNGQADATNDPYANRIGTLATVTFTHGDYDQVVGRAAPAIPMDHHQNNHNLGPAGPRPRATLILTAVGTGRFRILPRNDGDPRANSARVEHDLYYHRLFCRRVQQWSSEHVPSPGPKFTDTACLWPVSVWPKHIYDHYWPWSLMQDLRTKIDAMPSLKNIISSQEDDDHDHDKLPHHPQQFSYWLAVHLPLSERERLRILQCPTSAERLRWFLRHSLFFDVPPTRRYSPQNVLASSSRDGSLQQRQQSVSEQQRLHPDPSDAKELVCKSCQIPITLASHLFTLAGAEGTVGNYVNPHGIVHATMTVRHVDLNEVILQGRAETKDSWFPGYAWTIMSCALCYSHLGWKFTRVENSNSHAVMANAAARPSYFYGLSATGVTMITNPRRLRRMSWMRNSSSRRTRQRSIASEDSDG